MYTARIDGGLIPCGKIQSSRKPENSENNMLPNLKRTPIQSLMIFLSVKKNQNESGLRFPPGNRILRKKSPNKRKMPVPHDADQAIFILAG